MTVAPPIPRRVAAAVGGVDVGSSLDLVGAVLKWVGLTFLAPAAVAVGYGEPWWPFVVSGTATVVAGLGARPADRRPVGRRRRAARGLPRHRAAVARRARLRGAALPARRGARPVGADRRVLRVGVGLHRRPARRCSPTSRRWTARWSSGVSSATGWAAWASSSSPSPCCRACASAGATCSSASSPARRRSSA